MEPPVRPQQSVIVPAGSAALQEQIRGDITHFPAQPRQGLSLSLSGGGFRATIFHLGALRRLNELGILSRLDAVTSVSGGSMMAMCLADAMMSSPALAAGQPFQNFTALVGKVHALASCNLRRRILLERLEPQNWGHSLVELVAKELTNRVSDKPLSASARPPTFHLLRD